MPSLGLLRLKPLLKHGVTSVSGEISVCHFAKRLRKSRDAIYADSICLLLYVFVVYVYRQHGGASGMGQNLAASAGYKQTGQQVVDAWMSEEKDYNPSNPTYSHFTRESSSCTRFNLSDYGGPAHLTDSELQCSPYICAEVVWKSATQVGCYQSTCNKLYNPDGSETFPGFSPSYYVRFWSNYTSASP